MKFVVAFLFTTAAFAQNYTAYNNQPVARMSFLRSQCYGGVALSDSSMVAWWPLSYWLYTSGPIVQTNVAYDCSGHSAMNFNIVSKSAANTTNTTGYVAGKTGPKSIYFNKSNGEFINVTSITISAASFSVSAWVKPNALAASNDRVIEIPAFNTGFYLGTTAAGTAWDVIVDSATTTSCTGGTVGTAWTMVTMTYNGTSAYLYQNGAQIAGPCTFPNSTSLTAAAGRIGCYTSGNCSSSTGAWDGSVSDVRIYGRVLSATEVSAIYNAENH